MYQSLLLPLLLILETLFPTSSAIVVESKLRRDEKPALTYDPNTTKYCTWWYDNKDGSVTCSAMPTTFAISLSDFRRWVSRFLDEV
jgi:hypothetical protein